MGARYLKAEEEAIRELYPTAPVRRSLRASRTEHGHKLAFMLAGWAFIALRNHEGILSERGEKLTKTHGTINKIHYLIDCTQYKHVSSYSQLSLTELTLLSKPMRRGDIYIGRKKQGLDRCR